MRDALRRRRTRSSAGPNYDKFPEVATGEVSIAQCSDSDFPSNPRASVMGASVLKGSQQESEIITICKQINNETL